MNDWQLEAALRKLYGERVGLTTQAAPTARPVPALDQSSHLSAWQVAAYQWAVTNSARAAYITLDHGGLGDSPWCVYASGDAVVFELRSQGNHAFASRDGRFKTRLSGQPPQP